MTVPYAYISQPIVSTALIQQMDDDSFYFPEANLHNGFAFNGLSYTDGVQDFPTSYASWYLEGIGPYRGLLAQFPAYGLILLGRASLTILDESTPALGLWMTFLMQDGLLLTDNFAIGNSNYAADLQGFMPKGLAYANGVVSVVYSPDAGAETISSNLVVNIDFSQNTAYLDVAT